jgi:8-oxo-dGTP diphosphatase
MTALLARQADGQRVFAVVGGSHVIMQARARLHRARRAGLLMEQPRVGVGVTILRDGRVLLGRRRGSHGAGEYSSPGGHRPPGASRPAARRETREECGIEIDAVRFQFVANVGAYAPRHYVHIGLLADWAAGEARVLEPDKCEVGTGTPWTRSRSRCSR